MAGVVEATPRRGTVVRSSVGDEVSEALGRSVNYWALSELYDVRMILEGPAAERAAANATAVEILAMEAALIRMERRIARKSSYVAENSDFHLAIARGSHNNALVACLASIISTYREDHERLDRRRMVSETDMVEHRAVLVAIKARQPKEARLLMEQHLMRSAKWLEMVRSQAAAGKGEP
jgi:GntR family transcriptional repressor for pyruvate dehydrogenase complex